MGRATSRRCARCGAKFTGKGRLCLQCVPVEGVLASRKAPGPAPKPEAPAGGPVCPYCRTDVTWENIGASEMELSIYVREKMYYCPHCRSILGLASWHTEG